MLSLVIFILIYLGFFINIPFYIKWLKKQPLTDELYLYTVVGKFNYETVIELVNRIEVQQKSGLPKMRSYFAKLKEQTDRANKPYSCYKKKVIRRIKDESFGHPMMKGAFQRMSNYTKVVAVWDLFVILGAMNVFANLAEDGLGWLTAILFGPIVGLPLWLFSHSCLNYFIKSATQKEMKKHPEGTYLSIVMAQFYGFFMGMFWKDLMFVQGPNKFLYGAVSRYNIYGSSSYSGYGSSDFGGFDGGDFGGGGAGGDW